MRTLPLMVLSLTLVACSQDPTSPEIAPSTAPSVAFAKTADQGAAVSLVKQLVANSQSQGAVFFPEFSVDADGNLVFAGATGIFLRQNWPDGSLRHACLMFSNSTTNFFRVGPKDIAMNHVNGKAFIALIARSTEAGDPLPDLYGSGKLTMNAQGELDVLSFPGVALLNIGAPTSAAKVSGVGKVGEFTEDQNIKCGYTDDGNGNRRNGGITLN